MKLEKVVPWGRNIDEYRAMFMLNEDDMKKKIAGFGDGPASFNRQASEAGADVTSFDPIYRFSAQELKSRINEVRDIIIDQMKENCGNYVWDRIKSIDELEKLDIRQNSLIEVSGGITEDNILDYVEYGVDIISIGALTHSSRSLNFSLRME